MKIKDTQVCIFSHFLPYRDKKLQGFILGPVGQLLQIEKGLWDFKIEIPLEALAYE